MGKKKTTEVPMVNKSPDGELPAGDRTALLLRQCSVALLRLSIETCIQPCFDNIFNQVHTLLVFDEQTFLGGGQTSYENNTDSWQACPILSAGVAGQG